MNKWEEVKERLKHIIQVDVMTSNEWDFSATHMPFNHLFVQYSGSTSDTSTDMTEDEVYQKLVFNPDDEHRLIIVRGPNGAGKSHLIRWMRACLKSKNIEEYNKREKIVFIRRIDNTLRGAMRQLLEQGVVRDQQQYERMKQFIQASDVMNEAQLKATIYYTFITQVETDTSDTGYRPADRKRLASLLLDDRVKEFLMRPEGPVLRFYELLAQPKDAFETREPNFLSDDFTKMREIITEVDRESSPDVKSMIRRVISPSEAGKLANYLNTFSQVVIQSCANIVQGDIEEIIRQLRQDLKKQGKALTILIEDFTTFIGIDTEIIKVLSAKHGGEYEDLCRVTAIVGITDAYYQAKFLGNYKDRVTHQITVDNNSFGEESLAQMAVRYINAAYLTNDQVKKWYEQGADVSTLPYADYDPDYDWEYVDVDGRKFSLYPFNRNSLIQLYERLPEKAPRFFLRDIIRVQMSALVQKKLGLSPFPHIQSIKGPAIQFNEAQHASRFEGLPIPKADKQRLRALLCLWGEGHLREEKQGSHRVIAGLPVYFFKEFGFDNLSGIIRNPQANEPVTQIDSSPVVEVRSNRDYKNMVNDIENWYQKGKVLNSSEELRGLLRDFLVTSINWQMEGVPAYLAGAKLSNTRFIYIEGQRQQSTDRDKAIVTINNDLTGYNVLLSLCCWRYSDRDRGWDFKDSAYLQFKLIDWLEKNKDTIVSQAKGEPDANPEWTLQCSMALEYLRLGIMGYLEWQEEDASDLKKLFTKENQNAFIIRNDKDGAWSRAQSNLSNKKDILEKNKELLIMLPNSQMGRVTSGNDNKYLCHRDKIDQAYKRLRNMDWDASSILPDKLIAREELQNSAARMLQSLLPNIKLVLSEEKERATNLLRQLKGYMGDDLSESTWVDVSRKMADFLYKLNSTYHIHYQAFLRTNAEHIEQVAEKMATNCSQIEQIIKSNSFASQLAFFSSDPCQDLQKVINTMKDIENIAKNEGTKAKDAYAKMKSDDSTDEPMIELLGAGLITLKEKVEACGDDDNA